MIDTTMTTEERRAALEHGPLYSFSEWASFVVPPGAGVYTIWDDEGRFIYVGMSGRGLTRDDVAAMKESGERRGLVQRLASHASGRRSGDQFCVYVADRLVLPRLTEDEIRRIAEGENALFDNLIRDYIAANLAYRFIVTDDGKEASDIEVEIKAGVLSAGKPLLNPG
tara:strand:+ start:2847 stop:3350 length:504 start_codon:yes stop_codon:yes gene_type:complete